MAQNYSVYSFKDTSVVVNHPDVGQYVLSDGGMGRIVISYTAEKSSHTQTSNGHIVVNRLAGQNGTITLEVPQSSPADAYMIKLLNYLGRCNASRFALGTITIRDTLFALTVEATGVTPQKTPDRTYDSASAMQSYAMLAAEITEKQ